MRKLLLVISSTLVLAAGLAGCDSTSHSAAARATTASHSLKTMDNFGEIL